MMPSSLFMFDDFALQTRGFTLLMIGIIPAWLLSVILQITTSTFLEYTLLLFPLTTVLWQYIRDHAKKKTKYSASDFNIVAKALFRHYNPKRSVEVDRVTLDRYHRKLSTTVDGWTLPTLDQEKNYTATAEMKYKSAVNWLRENTRDRTRFSRVYAELISYIRQETLLGLRIIGIMMQLVCLAIEIAIGIAKYYFPTIDFYGVVSNFGSRSLILLFVATVVITVYWCFLVTERVLDRTAIAYARALLGAIDFV
jgi:hypothetical protein